MVLLFTMRLKLQEEIPAPTPPPLFPKPLPLPSKTKWNLSSVTYIPIFWITHSHKYFSMSLSCSFSVCGFLPMRVKLLLPYNLHFHCGINANINVLKVNHKRGRVAILKMSHFPYSSSQYWVDTSVFYTKQSSTVHEVQFVLHKFVVWDWYIILRFYSSA